MRATIGSRRALVALTSLVALVVGCDAGDEPPVAIPAAEDVATATLAAPGLEIVHAIVSAVRRDLVVLEATVVFDPGGDRAHQVAETRLSEELRDGVVPDPVDAGESWFADGRVLTRDPERTTVRPTYGDLSGMVLSDGTGESGRGVEADLVSMLDGWPGEVVDASELVEDVPTLHVRLERPDGDVLDVWVDGTGRLVRVERLGERSLGVVSESTFRYLDEPPTIPPIPDLAVD